MRRFTASSADTKMLREVRPRRASSRASSFSTTFSPDSRESGEKCTMRSMRLKSSGGKNSRTARSESSATERASCSPMPTAAFCRAPRLLVITMTVWVKSAVSPEASVSRPSSKVCSSRLSRAGWAFSISSSSTSVKGCSRIRRVRRPSGCHASPVSRATASGVWNSAMSSRTMREASPYR